MTTQAVYIKDSKHYVDSLLPVEAEVKKEFNVHPPPNETEEERTVRHDINGERFLQWAETNQCTLLVSYPRSGRHWIADILRLLTGKLSVMPYEINSDNYDDFALLTTHGYRFDYPSMLKYNPLNKVIILIRDPRDCALSNAYRSAVLGIPDFGHNAMCDGIVKVSVEQTLKLWYETYVRYMEFNHIVITYENLCCRPVETVSNILRFLGISRSPIEISHAVRSMDRMKKRHEGSEHIIPYLYETNRERFTFNCSKWVDNQFWDEELTNLVWERLHSQLKWFNYTRYGSAPRMFEPQIVQTSVLSQ